MKTLKIYFSVLIIYMIILVVRRTYRIRYFDNLYREEAKKTHQSGSYCLALWHEYLFAGILTHAGQKIAPLASLSADGEIVTRVMDKFGYRTIRGSSHRGGEVARDELTQVTSEGWFTAITVDGPRGPRRRVKGGVVDVARRTEVKIIPMVAAADREWVLIRSWDQFKIPKPFAKIAVQYGQPVIVPPDTQGLAFGEAKQQVRSGLEQCERLAREKLRTWK
jgi:lysophospholipid acyltransferase (LPLAT)-like uncharacterized protein